MLGIVGPGDRSSAPVALGINKEALSGLAKLADYAGTKQEVAMVKAIEELRQQLSDNECERNC